MHAVPSVRGPAHAAGLLGLAVAVCAMAIDHLVGTDRSEGYEDFPVDPAMFAIAVVLCLTAFAGTEGTTLPMFIFASLRFGVTPAITAMATMIIAVSLVAIVVAYLVIRRAGRQAGGALPGV